MKIDPRFRHLVASGQASQDQLERLGLEAVRSIKSCGKTPQMRAKASTDVVDLGDRVLRFRASDETPDRSGDIVRQAGWNLKHYLANPVVLWGHNDSLPPVGKSIAAKVEEDANGIALFLDIEFATKDQHELADTVYQLSKGQFLRANSVGFLPGEVYIPESEDERKELGLGLYGVDYRKSHELLEDSIVSVPANPNALQNGLRDLVGRGSLKAKEAERFDAHAKLTERDWERRAARLAEAARALVTRGADLTPSHPTLESEVIASLVAALKANTESQRQVAQELANIRYLSVPEMLRPSPPSGGSGRENPSLSAARLLRRALESTNGQGQ